MSHSHIAVGASLPAHVKDTYRACLEWYQSTLNHGGGIWGADPFIQEVDSSCHPFVDPIRICANRSSMYHHFCLLTLLQPFCHARSEGIVPVEICRESANFILSLAQICYQLKDFHICCFVPLFVFAAGMVDKYTVRALENHCVSPGRANAQFTGNRGDTTVSHDCKADSLSVLLGDDATAPCSLTDRALENLIQLSDTYPSARELALELESAMLRRYSISAVGEENSQEQGREPSIFPQVCRISP